VADQPDQPGKPSKIAEPRRRHEWLDHLMRAGASYTALCRLLFERD